MCGWILILSPMLQRSDFCVLFGSQWLYDPRLCWSANGDPYADNSFLFKPLGHTAPQTHCRLSDCIWGSPLKCYDITRDVSVHWIHLSSTYTQVTSSWSTAMFSSLCIIQLNDYSQASWIEVIVGRFRNYCFTDLSAPIASGVLGSLCPRNYGNSSAKLNTDLHRISALRIRGVLSPRHLYAFTAGIGTVPPARQCTYIVQFFIV
jgi:hypothetical protein